MKRKLIYCIALLLIFLAGCGCGKPNTDTPVTPPAHGDTESTPFVDESVIGDVDPEKDILAQEPALPDILQPEAPGTAAEENDKAVIDYSNITDGYVMVKYKAATDKKLKAQVKGPTTTYTYTIQPEEWTTFPMSDGNGEYKVTVFENVEGKQYATVASASVAVELEDEFAPFLRPNQYVDYGVAEETIKLGARLTQGKEAELDKVQAVYEYVVKNITYDTELAANVKSGYLPVLDEVLKVKKGICFDYAALMTGMLRSQSVPCKLVVGYAGDAYHAWISVYTIKDGWIDNAIYFDGTAWKRMDPTFASSGNKSDAIMKYIGDGSNYTEKYIY